MDMKREEFYEKLIDYLYDEMPPFEKKAFQREIERDPELQRELQTLTHLRELCQKELPDVSVPRSLTKKLYRRLGLRRPWFEIFKPMVLARPALAFAVLLVLTLGVATQYKRFFSEKPDAVALKSEAVKPAVAPQVSESAKIATVDDLKFSDLMNGNHLLKARVQPPVWRTQPSLGGGLVSLASLGSPSMLGPSPQGMRGVDIPNLHQEADFSVAQFAHQQALRLRSMGDFKGAANALAHVIKAYPNYPGKFQALAERIDCLFRSGQQTVARKELAWLRGLSPDLAYLVESRWTQSN